MFSGFGFGRRNEATAPSPEPPQRFTAAGSAEGTKSLELIRYNAETEKFELGQAALEVLKKTRGPVGVVSVAGRARQGKSYILNQLLGRSGGFTVGPTHRPCTKGLWMWSAPVERTAPDGTRYSLVLLDTEGIDAYDQTGQYSTQIFSLAVLLSSLFIYNQMGGIDEAALDRLSLVTEMTKHIRVRASDGAAADASELAAFTPSFVWLLRDFYLRLEEEGRQVTPRDYLESALSPLPGSGQSVDAKNQIRDSIKALFPDRDCFALVRPVNDEEALAKLDTLATNQLRPEFRDGLSRLARMVFHKAQPKRLGAQVLTGPVLAGLAEAYVSAINAGAVPTIATAWQGVAESESRRAADAAEAAYAAAFPANVPAEDAALDAAHQRALAEAQRAFDAIAVGDENVRGANEKRWRDACTSRFKELREKKVAAAELAAEKAVNEGAARLQAVVRRPNATLEDLQREMQAFQQQYAASKDITGPVKWRRMAEFMRDAYATAQRDLSDKIAERQRAATAAAEQAAAAAREQAQQASARATTAEGSLAPLRARVADLERQLTQVQTELTQARTEAATQRQLAADRQSKLDEMQRGAQQRASQAESELTRALASVQQQLETARAENVRLQQHVNDAASRASAGFETERGRLQASLDAVTKARDDAQAAQAQAVQRVAALKAEAGALRAQVVSLQAENQQAAAVAAAAAAAAAVVPPPAPQPAPAAVLEDAEEDDAFADAVDGGADVDAGVQSMALSVPDTRKMTINAMKEWLMEHGFEAQAWELSNKKGAKKADWQKLIESLGQ